MTQHNKERHAAAMLVHQLGSGIEALEDMSPAIAMENAIELGKCFTALGEFLIRIHEIEAEKLNQLRMHQ